MKKLVITAIIFALSGCATPPQQHQIVNEATVSRTKHAVWADLMEWFTSNQVQIKTVEKDSGIIYAERAYAVGSAVLGLADCGMLDQQPIAPQVVGLNVFVRELTARSTKVTVNASYSSGYLDPWNGRLVAVQCNSKGGLEGNILAAVGQ